MFFITVACVKFIAQSSLIIGRITHSVFIAQEHLGMLDFAATLIFTHLGITGRGSLVYFFSLCNQQETEPERTSLKSNLKKCLWLNSFVVSWTLFYFLFVHPLEKLTGRKKFTDQKCEGSNDMSDPKLQRLTFEDVHIFGLSSQISLS